MKATLVLKGKQYELHSEDGQVIDRKNIGWISEYIDKMYTHLPRNINHITEDDFQIILEQEGQCYIEMEERRKMSEVPWEKAIDSYSMEGDPWYHEIRLIDNQIILHFT